jgi:hypothetical protein
VNERANGSQLTRIRSEGGISDAGWASGGRARLAHLRGIRPGSEKVRQGGGTSAGLSWGEEALGLLTLAGLSSIGETSSTKAFWLSSDVERRRAERGGAARLTSRILEDLFKVGGSMIP